MNLTNVLLKRSFIKCPKIGKKNIYAFRDREFKRTDVSFLDLGAGYSVCSIYENSLSWYRALSMYNITYS